MTDMKTWLLGVIERGILMRSELSEFMDIFQYFKNLPKNERVSLPKSNLVLSAIDLDPTVPPRFPDIAFIS